MPTTSSPSVGFIGFGEAGSLMACGLAQGGAARVLAFDPLLAQASEHPRRAQATAFGVQCVDRVADLVQKADIVLSTVVARAALDVAQEASASLRAGQLYVDLNSVSPETKQAIAAAISPSGACFVEGAIMTNVAKRRQQTPIFACGPGAADFTVQANAMGMAVENLGPELGRASATKMFRSILVKGLEALFLECLLAAEHYGVGDKVLEKVQEGYPGPDWQSWATQFLARTVEHGERRADEMREVAQTLREMGIEPFMAEGAAERIAFCGRGLKERFAGRPLASYREAIAAMRDRHT